ncbi:hypothetical protein PG993_007008 [Apiospora rasikravindrae]|uniref:2EXR domain-containing protein n=1 Tax=Apiospora rasikravindrae TaxID=990691 RepID=A0ABR1SWA6_9PEZI
MSTFPMFKKFPPELRCMIWEEALREEVESRFVFVHRVSMKVLPHKNTNKNAIMATNQESRGRALRFYDIRLDVWTFAPINRGYTYAREIDLYCGPRIMWPGVLTREEINALFTRQGVERPWALRSFNEIRGRVSNQLKQAPRHTPGSRLVGRIYLNSELDKFTLSDKIQVYRPDRNWPLGLVVHYFLKEHENRFRGAMGDRDKYVIRYMTVCLPKRALERIRRVIKTYWTDEPDEEHVCQTATKKDRDWKLGSFKGADQLYTLPMEEIPAEGFKIGEVAQNLIEWKRTGPNAPLPFVCACGDADLMEQNEQDAADEEANPDDQ